MPGANNNFITPSADKRFVDENHRSLRFGLRFRRCQLKTPLVRANSISRLEARAAQNPRRDARANSLFATDY